MKRDMDLIREILIKLEALPPHDELASDEINCDKTEEEITEHMLLIEEAGLAEGLVTNFSDFKIISLQRLTNSGHDYLDMIRRDTIWNKIKETAREKGIELTIDGVKAIGSLVLTQIIGGAS